MFTLPSWHYQIITLPSWHCQIVITKLALPNCPYRIDVTKNPPVGITRIKVENFDLSNLLPEVL